MEAETSRQGKSFEHLVLMELMELMAYQAYASHGMEVRFWRTAHGTEVDFIVDDMALAIEVKGSSRVHEGDTRGLRTLAEEGPVRRRIVVCLEPEPRTIAAGIEVLPWHVFFARLWAGEFGV